MFPFLQNKVRRAILLKRIKWLSIILVLSLYRKHDLQQNQERLRLFFGGQLLKWKSLLTRERNWLFSLFICQSGKRKMWFGKIFQISSSFNAVERAQKEKTNDFVKQPPTPTPPPHRFFSLFLHCIPLPNSTCLPSDCDPALFQPELSAGFAWQFPPGVSSSDYNRKWSENENVTRSVSTLWFNPALTSTYLQSWDEAT